MATPGNVMIITGASSGFGKLTAVLAAQRGYRVVVAARRAERLTALVEEIEMKGGTALAVPCDVTKPEDQKNLIDQTLRRFGRIDVLVNNAGVPLKESFADATLDDLRRQWETNVLSLVLLTKRALPALMRSRGVVINIGSMAGHFSLPGWGNYYPTKVSVRSLSHALRRELLPYGVRVSLVEPGPFKTEFADVAGVEMFGLEANDVAKKIIRLAERPRRTVMAPGWMGLIVLLAGGLAALLPDVVDLVFLAMGRRKLGGAKDAPGGAPATAS